MPRGFQVGDRIHLERDCIIFPSPPFGPAFGLSQRPRVGLILLSIPLGIVSRRFPLKVVCGWLPIVVVELLGSSVAIQP